MSHDLKRPPKFLVSAGLATAMFGLLSGPAMAQTGSSSESDEPASTMQLEEVMVTARRKVESLQDVPVAITALSGDELERMRLTAVEDLRNVVPGVNVSGLSRDTANFYIRGQGQVNGTTGSRTNSGITQYFAEVPIDLAGPGVFYDLENVQVLKGPQGILFGRNTTGGAVLYEPHRPEFGNSGYVQGQVGNYDLRQGNFMGNFEAVPDMLAVRVAGEFVQRDGFTESIVTGQEKDDREYQAVRASFLFAPSERFENQLIMDYRETKSNGAGLVMTALNGDVPFGTIPLGEPAAAILSAILGEPVEPGELPLTLAGANANVACLSADAPGAVVPADCPEPIFGFYALGAYAQAVTEGNGFYYFAPEATFNDIIETQNRIGTDRNQSPIPTKLEREMWGVVNKTIFDITDSLLVKNIISYRHSRELQALDFTGIPLPLLQILGPGYPGEDWTGGIELFTEELQFQGSLGDNLSYIIGGYYEEAEPGTDQSTLGGQLGEVRIRNSLYDDKSMAVFGHVEWAVSDVLTLAGGARKTWDERYVESTEELPDGTCLQPDPITGGGGCPLTNEDDFDAVTWDVSVRWTPNDELMLYAAVRRGYRAGGLNVPVYPAPPPQPVNAWASYDAEYVDEIEIGAKYDFLFGGVPGRFNVAAFWDDFTDQQLPQIVLYTTVEGNRGAASIYDNIAESEIKGIEAELSLQPLDSLVLGLFASYLDATPKDTYIDETGVARVIEGRQLPNQPEEKYGATAAYTFELGDMGTIIASANYSYQSSFYSTNLPSIADPNKSYELINARVSWERVGGSNFDLSVFGTNLGDETYELGGYPVDQLGFASSVYGEPRMYGVSLKYSFGEY